MGIFSNPPRKYKSTTQPGDQWIRDNLHWLPTNVWVAADDSGLLAHHEAVDIVTQMVPAELRQSAAYTLYFVHP
jgi:hypothetical protein